MERKRTCERTLSLEKLSPTITSSPIVTTRLKHKSLVFISTPSTPSAYKMNTKLKKLFMLHVGTLIKKIVGLLMNTS
jgi:hypothetical protein